ncbi:hypothetical protein GSI_05910 [Ganoderma sinense ZZ0214-1]|uniref:Uncharacterized protein n=1 Tax=Ganoderma sinense ZZ0214-1 TaxID=1077348 RepID=A0A2G8SBU1_9APHY|nr:hypothetical protein GSI_05910 [Ganoderma sinense ZZ0214-1]
MESRAFLPEGPLRTDSLNGDSSQQLRNMVWGDDKNGYPFWGLGARIRVRRGSDSSSRQLTSSSLVACGACMLATKGRRALGGPNNCIPPRLGSTTGRVGAGWSIMGSSISESSEPESMPVSELSMSSSRLINTRL